MLDLNSINFRRVAAAIGNDISSQENKELIATIQRYKFGFIATIEAMENRDLTPEEIMLIHNKFLSRDFIDTIAFENPETGGAYEKEVIASMAWFDEEGGLQV